MTLEEIFYDLDRQYGDSFSWRMLPLTDRSFAAELKREIGESHPLWGRRLWAVARCDSDDRALYLTEDGEYYVVHLTWSGHNEESFPRCRRLSGIEEVREVLEREALTGMG